MEQIFDLIQNTNLGLGEASPNKLLIKVVGSPYSVEGVKKVMTYFKVYYEGMVGEGEHNTSEYILWREGNQEVEANVLFYLLDVDSNREVINQILSTFTFNGFLTNFTLEVQ